MEKFKATDTHIEKPEDLKVPVQAFAQLKSIQIGETESTLEFLKVRHTPETLDVFGEDIERHIQDAEVLISELAVFDEDENPSDIEVFYKKVTELAQKYKKEMIVADPEREISDAFVNRSVDIAPSLAAIGSSVYIAKKLSEISNELTQRRFRERYNITQEQKAVMSRRDFLKGVGAAAIVTAGSLHGAASLFEEIGIRENESAQLEQFLLDSLDYRNALIAKEIIRQAKIHTKVSMIYGAAHIHGIEKFINNPDLLEEKLDLYEKTYGLINESQPMRYSFA